STRYPGLAPGGRLRSTNLYVVNQDGSGLHRITTERFGADTPAIDPSTGRIVYSRWWLTAQANPPPPGGPSPDRPPQYYGPVIGYPGQDGLRRLSRPSFEGTGSTRNPWPVALGGPQTFLGDANLRDPNPVSTPKRPSPAKFFYGSAVALPAGPEGPLPWPQG